MTPMYRPAARLLGRAGSLGVLLLLVTFLAPLPAYAATTTISDQASCEAAGGTFLDSGSDRRYNRCSLGDRSVDAGDTLVIGALDADFSDVSNAGTIIVAGDRTLVRFASLTNNSGALLDVRGTSSFLTIVSSLNNLQGATISAAARFDVTSSNTVLNRGTINANSMNLKSAAATNAPTGVLNVRGLLEGPALDNQGQLNFTTCSGFNAVVQYTGNPPRYPDCTGPAVVIEQAATQADPALTQPITFAVTFGEDVTGFTASGVALSGTAGGVSTATSTITGSGATYQVKISGLTGAGTVIAKVAAGAVRDAAGNGSSASTSTDNTVTYSPDPTPPVITPVVSGTTGDNGWYTGDVTVSWTVTDPESPVTSPACPATVRSTDTTPAGVTYTCSATSAGGTAQLSVTIRRDATAPVLNPTITPNPASFGGTATADPGASDDASGLATASCTTPSTATVGPATVTCTATDKAGNTATKNAGYSVAAIAPGSPTQVVATPADSSLKVTWTAPASTGGIPLTGYTVTARDTTDTTAAPVRVTTTGTSTTVTGLVPGHAYTVTVVATNSAGDSPPSAASAPATPYSAPAIAAPPALNATAGTPFSYQFALSGSPTPTLAPATGATLPAGLSLTAAGRLSGTPTTAGTFTFTATAVNGTPTTASRDVTITIAAGAPAAVTATSGSGQASTATQPFAAPLVATVTDAYANPAPGQTVTFTVTSGSATFPTGKATATAVTTAAGTATAPVLTAGKTSGPVTVTATTASATPATFNETVLSTTTARADLQVSISAPATVARNSTFTATVTVKNNGPNAAGSLQTTLSTGLGIVAVTAPGGTLAPGAVLYPATGLASGATLTYTVTLRTGILPLYLTGLSATSLSVVPDPKLTNNSTTSSLRIT